MYKLVEQCRNSQTYDFNWKLWFDNRDAIFYGDSSLELIKTAQAELQSLWKAQINLLNMYLDLMLMYGKVSQENYVELTAASAIPNKEIKSPQILRY